MPTVIAKLTLLAIAVGAVSANVLNIYSGAIASIAMGIKLPFAVAAGHHRAGLRSDRPARRVHRA
jgi:D-serine deaminase-like pyridoxal phosphate-dependent protein